LCCRNNIIEGSEREKDTERNEEKDKAHVAKTSRAIARNLGDSMTQLMTLAPIIKNKTEKEIKKYHDELHSKMPNTNNDRTMGNGVYEIKKKN
jgi:hypothetical protein